MYVSKSSTVLVYPRPSIKTIGFFIGFFAFSNFLLAQNEDLFNYPNSLRYAKHLFQTQNYKAAATEYERVLFFAPSDTAIQHQLLNSYLKAGQFGIGIQRTQLLYPSLDSIPATISLSFGKMLMLYESYEDLDRFAVNSPTLLVQDKHFLQIGHSILTEKWSLAQALYSEHIDTEPKLQFYGTIIQKSQQLRLKKPAIATALSVVVPGLGRVYTKQWKDGLISVAIIGGLAWTAIRNFNRNGRESIAGWIYGGLALGFYGGNIFGSYRSAIRYNQLQSNMLIHDAKDMLLDHN